MIDPLSKLIAQWKIPVGVWGKAVIDFIITYFEWLFDGIKDGLNAIVETTTWILLQCPPLLLALAMAGVAYWLQKSKYLALGVLLGLLFIINQFQAVSRRKFGNV